MDSRQPLNSRTPSIGYSDELRIRPANEELLQRVADVSGGRFSPSASAVFDLPGETRRPVPLWPWLTYAALFLFVLDVALRRIDFSLHWPFAQR